MKTRHVLSVLVENRFGELARVVGLFSGRGFNIDSLAVNVTMDPAFSRIVLTTRGNEAIVEQIVKQLRKLIRVKKVVEVTEDRHIERELVLAKVRADAKTRSEIVQIADIFRAKIVNLTQDSLIIELTGTDDKIGALLSLLEPFGILEIARTGRLALKR